MTVVKGSKLYPVKVIHDRPYRRIGFILIAILAAIGFAAFSYFSGYTVGMAGQKKALSDVASLTVKLSEAQTQSVELEQRLANLKLGTEVDSQANEEVRKEVLVLKDEMAKLQEENSFYRGLMAPTKNKRGLNFGVVEIGQTEALRTFRYKVVMQQLATNHQLLTGTLDYRVIGKDDGVEVIYKLNELSSAVTNDTVRLRFKYFQTIEGEMTLPEGFEPEKIELVARSTGKDPVTVEKRFGWLVEEIL